MSIHGRPPESLRARVLEAAARSQATAPGTWRRRTVLFAGGAAAWIVGTALLLCVRRDFHHAPLGELAQTVALLVAIAIGASAAGLARGRAMGGPSSETLLGSLLGLPVLLLAVVAILDPRGPASVVFPGGAPASTLAQAVRCDLLVTAVGLPLIGAAWAMARGLMLARPMLSGACVGLAAATWAHAVVRVHCGVGGAPHAIVAHLLPALPLMAVGAWASWAASRQRGIRSRSVD